VWRESSLGALVRHVGIRIIEGRTGPLDRLLRGGPGVDACVCVNSEFTEWALTPMEWKDRRLCD